MAQVDLEAGGTGQQILLRVNELLLAPPWFGGAWEELAAALETTVMEMEDSVGEEVDV